MEVFTLVRNTYKSYNFAFARSHFVIAHYHHYKKYMFKNVKPSANNTYLELLICLGKLFINIANKRGPRLLPRGTPEVAMNVADNLLPSFTFCLRHDK